jgi:hypothetical protein
MRTVLVHHGTVGDTRCNQEPLMGFVLSDDASHDAKYCSVLGKWGGNGRKMRKWTPWRNGGMGKGDGEMEPFGGVSRVDSTEYPPTAAPFLLLLADKRDQERKKGKEGGMRWKDTTASPIMHRCINS